MQRYRSGHNGADSKSVWEQSHEGSNPSRCATSEQSPLCSDVFLCLWQKRRHPPAPLLLLSNCDPLRWARSWWAALRAAFFSTKMSILTISPPKRLEIARFQAFFALSWQNGIVKLSKSAQESAQTLKIGALSFTNAREKGNGYHLDLGGAVPEIFIDNFTARWYSTREKTAMTEKSPQLSVQREARQVKGLYGRRRAVPLPSGPG